VSLAGGVWIGATLVHGYNPIVGFLRLLDTYVVSSLADSANATIVLVSFFITGMLAIISKSGGAAGVAVFVTKYARNSKNGQQAAWFTGLALFFDDYANILVNGNAFRPIVDELRISRAKLAFICDCSAAAFASIAPFSTWITFEVGLIEDEIQGINANGGGIQTSAYALFLYSVPYSFYQIMMLAFSLIIASSNRDFGPMIETESNVRQGKPEEQDENAEEAEKERQNIAAKPGVPELAMNCFIPIVSVIVSIMVGLVWTGAVNTIADGGSLDLPTIVGNAESYNVLIWSSMMGLIVPMVSLKMQGIMEPMETLQVWFSGMSKLIEPLFVLLGAWSLGTVVKELQLPAFFIQLLGPSVPVGMLPTLVFVIAGIIAFSTGTSFGTMAVMFPLVVPLAWQLSGVENTVDVREQVLIQNIGAILGGAIFGDHCSPISDTTILSSMATGCKATEHVRTQLPYALMAGVVAIVFGYFPTAFLGLPQFVCMILGWGALIAITIFLGTPVEQYEPDAAAKAVEAPGNTEMPLL